MTPEQEKALVRLVDDPCGRADLWRWLNDVTGRDIPFPAMTMTLRQPERTIDVYDLTRWQSGVLVVMAARGDDLLDVFFAADLYDALKDLAKELSDLYEPADG